MSASSPVRSAPAFLLAASAVLAGCAAGARLDALAADVMRRSKYDAEDIARGLFRRSR